jgi:hypothetical protein
MKKTLLACALSIASITSVYAQTEPNPLRFMVGIGLTAGGDNVATANYTDGSTNNISAGTGIQLMTGVDYRLNQSVSFQATVGYRGRFALGSNGNASFDRYPIELLGYYNLNEKWRLGGGIQYIHNPSLNASGALAYLSEDFKSTTGIVLETEYFPMPHLGIKFRAVKENYTPIVQPYSGYSTDSINGSHIGVLSDYYF